MKKTKTKFDHNIYIEAAERISSDRELFSCNAVYHAADKSGLYPDKNAIAHETLYQKTFKLNPLCSLRFCDIGSVNYDDLKQFRILALLFMAEFVKDLNKKK